MAMTATSDTVTIVRRPAAQRGHLDHGWLDTYHTFSFGEYHDEAHMGFGPLRVINEDVVAPGRGFGMHPHKSMEIITYVLSGELEHRDSLGNRGIIKPGEVQRMSAGSGIRHSEMNASPTTPVHLIQIWITPREAGGAPTYDQRSIRATPGTLAAIATPDGSDGTTAIRQDATVFAGAFPGGGKATHTLRAGRRAWVQMARGSASANGTRLEQGDGAAMIGSGEISLSFDPGAEVLFFDLP